MISWDAVDVSDAVLSCYADVPKAFDCVDAAVLLRKMESVGVKNSP